MNATGLQSQLVLNSIHTPQCGTAVSSVTPSVTSSPPRSPGRRVCHVHTRKMCTPCACAPIVSTPPRRKHLSINLPWCAQKGRRLQLVTHTRTVITTRSHCIRARSHCIRAPCRTMSCYSSWVASSFPPHVTCAPTTRVGRDFHPCTTDGAPPLAPDAPQASLPPWHSPALTILH